MTVKENFIPWAGGEGPNAWKMNRFLRSTEPIRPAERTEEAVLHEMTEGIEVDLPKNPADLGNNKLW